MNSIDALKLDTRVCGVTLIETLKTTFQLYCLSNVSGVVCEEAPLKISKLMNVENGITDLLRRRAYERLMQI